ncbi:diguanylate cyclase/phosphodiesterase [Micromonospora pattaloongensis]|uniref:Diguanylate cyclase/phosphodiesterase n=1 Tax=Micromonospora pattaloongensis TaxID=405436 RepID=A0A1H3M7X0_9ACTN|nr:bifunctional diguanylate cyclase/phosphodiesterase [Micromonospora pattaloongensis]SDY72837.1 diguanylate cyclase/phosphodiesterase [Micromonospora pattaloongensis]
MDPVGAAPPVPARPGAPPDATGPGHPKLLTAVLLTVAVCAAGLGAAVTALPSNGVLPPVAQFGAVAGLIVLAQFAALRLKIASGSVSVTWNEAAFIVGLYLAPGGWLPAATLVGAALAWTLLSIFGERRAAVEVVHTAASLTVAVALATAVTSAFAHPYRVPPDPVLAVALIAGALTYLVVSAVLAALTLSLRHALPIWPILRRAVQSKLLMFVGNLVVGMVVVAMVHHDPRWLLLLPPVLWLLQQTYGHRLRADDERRAWHEFARATGALNQLDERSVAAAGISGALTLFGAEQVEVDVVRADGVPHRYTGRPDGVITDAAAPAGSSRETGDNVLVRSLLVGGLPVGELRVWLPRSALPGAREQNALSAFGDALGAALHDAATHRELRLITARSSYEAVHDSLTNLLNRAAMLSRGDAALHQLPHDHPVALVLLDLNHFKEVNDTLGHVAGDELLRVTGARLGALTRPDELLGRLGGDEFALLVTALPVRGEPAAVPPGGGPAGPAEVVGSLPAAVRRARKIVDGLAAPTEVAGVKMSVEASAGVVVAGAGAADMTELLRRADIAMYQAKTGGSGVAAYDSATDAASTDQLALLAELREALDADDQLVLALQPSVDLTTGAPTGVEALIRWQHPRRGWLNPADFIRAVEHSELLAPFTRYVVDRALDIAAEWARHGLDVPISVNVSARSLLDARLPAQIGELLRRHQVPADRLVLEITETVVMSELEVIDEVLGALRELGVRLAVDDFGTGFSSLTFLTRISVDELKVDRSFVVRMADSPQAAAIVRTTIDLGRQLGLRVVAEGVETADQRAALAQLGCAAAQGYHFFKPMPADKIVAVLRSLLDSAQAQILPLRADGAS